MRSKYIPEEVRSTVMNVFRMGLNAVVVLTLINIGSLALDTVFLLTVGLLAVAVVAQHRLFTLAGDVAGGAGGGDAVEAKHDK